AAPRGLIALSGAGEGDVELSVGLMSLALAIGQFFVGPWSDRFGRRRLLMGGLMVYIISAAAVTFVPDFDWFLWVRFIQGLATAAFILLSRTIIRDMFTAERAARLLSFVYLALGMSSVLSPFIGSQLLELYGWRADFYLLSALALVVLILVITKLPETAPAGGGDYRGMGRLLGDYVQILRNPVFRANLAVNCMFSMGLISFVSASAPVYITFLGESPEAYAVAVGIVFSGSVAGSLVSSRVVVRAGIRRVLLAAAIVAAASGTTLLGLSVAGVVSAVWITIPMFCFLFAFALGSPQTVAAALTPFPNTAGTASSVFGVVQGLAIAGASFLLSVFADGTQWPMVIMVWVVGITSLVLYLALIRPRAGAAPETAAASG
ncbi:MAG: MFS transporter, partial [Rhodospirillales bacterium]|nr:MFS transporter [Rhodospirillales bacterium]